MAVPPDNAGDRPVPPTEVVELAVNLDDASPEVVGAAVEALWSAGALDVWTMPIGMKKQRPGVMLCLLCDVAERSVMARRMLELTGSFGVRWRPWERLVLDRRFVTLETPAGPVRMKVGELDGQVLVVRPEYEDVRRLGQEQGMTVREAMSEAEAAAQRWRREQAAAAEPGGGQ